MIINTVMLALYLHHAQYHSLSRDDGGIGDPPKTPAFSWERPGWNEGSTSFNTRSPSGSSSLSGGGSVTPSVRNSMGDEF